MHNTLKADIIFFCLLFLVLANVFVWQFLFTLDGNLKVTFFDVGEGDSIFVETPQGHQILIDGGPGLRVLDKLTKALPFWDRTLDLVILTHPEYDHLAGLNAVLSRYEIKNILWNGVTRDTAVFKEWQKALEQEDANVAIVKNGELIKAGPARALVLWPNQNLAAQQYNKDSNETSVVLRLDYASTSFLFTGDLPKKAERNLLGANHSLLASNVLKVAHHGSSGSSGFDFLGAVRPQVAVISVGRNNRYNHPAPATLQGLAEFAITVLRTDELGDIKITTNGHNFFYR